MVTHKTFPNHRVFETQIGNRTFTVETGKVAELANAECICRYGDTVVLTTVTASPDPKPGIDYFPLTIEFEERLYSVGRIPGSFNRREGKPSERGILNSRLIDRPMRPLFDEELRNDVVVTCTVWPMITTIRWKSWPLWVRPFPLPLPTYPGTALWPPPMWHM